MKGLLTTDMGAPEPALSLSKGLASETCDTSIAPQRMLLQWKKPPCLSSGPYPIILPHNSRSAQHPVKEMNSPSGVARCGVNGSNSNAFAVLKPALTEAV